jgi:hypothetical protein
MVGGFRVLALGGRKVATLGKEEGQDGFAFNKATESVYRKESSSWALIGLDHETSSALILVQDQFRPTNKTNVQSVGGLRDKLIQLGADDILLADGSDSVFLTIDKSTVVSPGFEKDLVNPVGLVFHLDAPAPMPQR